MGGRVTLIHSVLATMPIYRMAFAPIPVGVAKELSAIQRKFLWGEKKNGPKKMAWVKWKAVCKPKLEGGLGVRNFSWLNAAMLGKWVWRLLHEKERLWAKVILSRHGQAADSFGGLGGERDVSRGGGWWNKVRAAVVGNHVNWFFSRLTRVLGDGQGTRFWDERWGSEDTSLKERFPRLFYLCIEKEGKVADMGKWIGESWEWDVRWRRQLTARDAEAATVLRSWLEEISFKKDERDAWKWGPNGSFSIKEAYAVIASHYTVAAADFDEAMLFRALWKAQAPLKQKITRWRALWDRLPTRDNLVKRFEIPADGRSCVCCEEEDESALHILIRCSPVKCLWQKIIGWVGVSWAAPRSLRDHFVGFVNLMKGKGARKKLGDLWLCAIWVIWRWRNKCIFEKEPWEFRRMEEEINCRFWSWCGGVRSSGCSSQFLGVV